MADEDESLKRYRQLYGPTISPPFSSDIPGFGVRQFDDRSKPYYAQPGVGVTPQPSTSYGTPLGMNRSFFPAANRFLLADDSQDLSRDTENAFYGGGNAPAPSPTPAPTTPWWRGWNKGTPTPAPRGNFVTNFQSPNNQFGLGLNRSPISNQDQTPDWMRRYGFNV